MPRDVRAITVKYSQILYSYRVAKDPCRFAINMYLDTGIKGGWVSCDTLQSP